VSLIESVSRKENAMFRTLIAMSVFAAMLTTAVAQDDPVAKKAKLVEDRTKKVIDGLKEEEKKQDVHLQRLKKGILDKTAKGVMMPANEKQPVRFPNKDAKDKTVDTAEKKLTETKDRLKKYTDGTEFYYGVLDYPPKIGDFGKVYHGDTIVNVRQVIDKNTMLIRVYYTVKGVKILGKPGNQVVVDDFQTKEVMLMVKGFPTKGATDGAGFDLPQVFEVTDTETYKTALGGSNTVFVIEPMDTKKIEAHLKK
jgi:hypothetical protein